MYRGNADRASTGRLIAFMMIGFTLVFGFLLSIIRVGFSFTQMGKNTIPEGQSALQVLINSIVVSLPIAVVLLFCFIIFRKGKRIDTVGKFLKLIFGSSIVFYLLALAYFAFTRGRAFMMFIGSHGAAIPLLAVIAGLVLWQLRKMFGIKFL